MARQTWLGDVLKPLNSEVGKFVPGWGTTPIMAALIGFILLLLVVMLEVYNSSIVLDGIDVSWTSLGS